jgi:hypothetical protein
MARKTKKQTHQGKSIIKKPVQIKNQASTQTIHRWSLMLMVLTSVIAAGIITGSLILIAMPKSFFSSNSNVVKSIKGFDSTTLLVKFAPKLKEVDRLAILKTAYEKQVRCTTLTTGKKWEHLRRVEASIPVSSNCTVQVVSITPIVPTTVNLEAVSNTQRVKRADINEAKTQAAELKLWYQVTLKSDGVVDMESAVATLRASAGTKVTIVSTNPLLAQAASMGAVKSTSSAFASIKVKDAQDNVYGVAGDANDDGVLNWQDSKYVLTYIYNGGPAPVHLNQVDLNADGSVDISDAVLMIELLGKKVQFTPTDLNHDGKVDLADAQYIVNYLFNQGPAPATLSNADYNQDGSVDVNDAVLLISQVMNNTPTVQCARGDANGDGTVDLSDANYLNDYLFANGSAPVSKTCGDADGDETVDVADLVYLLRMLNPLAQPASLSDKTSTAPILLNGGKSEPSYLTGDTNSDFLVNSDDALFLLKYVFQGGQAPEPLLRGDVNGDGQVDASDAIELFQLVNVPQNTRIAAADINGDGTIDALDVKVIIDFIFNGGSAPNTTLADVNNDGSVNISDALIIANYLAHSATVPSVPEVRTNSDDVTYLVGDANGDGSVDKQDVSYLSNYVFKHGSAPIITESSDVNGDTRIDVYDIVVLVNMLRSWTEAQSAQPLLLRGDINNDRIVDPKDLVVLVSGIKNNATIFKQGDINRDGRVDFLDAVTLTHLLNFDNPKKPLADINKDGKVNFADVDYLLTNIFSNGSAPADMTAADINGDGAFDISDAVTFIEMLKPQGVLQYLPSDANADGLVNKADIAYLVLNIFKNGQAPTPLARADLNGDGRVDISDVVMQIIQQYPELPSQSAVNTSVVALLDSGYTKTSATSSFMVTNSEEVPLNGIDDDKNGYIDDAAGWNVVQSDGVINDETGQGSSIVKLISQVTPSAKLLPVKVANSTGQSNCFIVSSGLMFAVQSGADVANISLSGLGSCSLLDNMVAYAKARGVVVVAAAGNDTNPISTLQKKSEALIVGGLEGLNKSTNSNTGDIYAPIKDADGALQGTSVSSAYISAGAALILTQTPAIKVSQVIDTLQSTSKTLTGSILQVNLDTATK